MSSRAVLVTTRFPAIPPSPATHNADCNACEYTGPWTKMKDAVLAEPGSSSDGFTVLDIATGPGEPASALHPPYMPRHATSCAHIHSPTNPPTHATHQVTIAKLLPNAKVIATDVSPDMIKQVRSSSVYVCVCAGKSSTPES